MSSGPKGPEIMFRSDVETLHRSDNLLLTNLVDHLLWPVLHEL